MKSLIKEHFDSLYQMLDTINSRPHNAVMKSRNSSHDDDYDFTHTHNYEEAEKLMKFGYTEILPKIREGIIQTEKQVKTILGETKKTRPRNNVIGFVPNVPNAIQGLPESMITIDRTIQKKKCINIEYVMEGNYGTDAEMWVKSGITLLTAIKLIELTGISVKLNVCFFAGKTDDQKTFPTVTVKNYQDRLDLQKLCFPIAHPSMFRRFGFAWLETHPDIEDNSYAFGYGRSYDTLSAIKETFNFPDNTFVLNGQWIEKHENRVIDVIKYLNNQIKEDE